MARLDVGQAITAALRAQKWKDGHVYADWDWWVRSTFEPLCVLWDADGTAHWVS